MYTKYRFRASCLCYPLCQLESSQRNRTNRRYRLRNSLWDWLCMCAQSCPTLLWTHGLYAFQASLSMGFSMQEYWKALPFPSPGDLFNTGIKPTSLASPALVGDFFTTFATWELTGKSKIRKKGWNIQALSKAAAHSGNSFFREAPAPLLRLLNELDQIHQDYLG